MIVRSQSVLTVPKKMVNTKRIERTLLNNGFSWIGDNKFKFITDYDKRYPYRTLGLQFKAIRKSLVLTQDEIADKLKCNQSYIANIEAGKEQISLQKIKEISKILGVECVFLLKKL